MDGQPVRHVRKTKSCSEIKRRELQIHAIIGKNLGCTVLSKRKPDSRLLSEDILERADEKAAPWLRGAGVEMGWAGIVCGCWNDSMS